MRFFQTLLRAWQDLLKAPSSSLANILVIGVALSIPTVGYGLAKSATELSFALEHKPHINVFISPDISPADIQVIEGELAFTNGIQNTEIISKEDALKSFEAVSGIKNVLDSLEKNPLPTTLIITPKDEFLTVDGIQNLIENIKKIDGIDEVQVNQDWLERLNMISDFATIIIFVLAGLIAFAIVFILSNTIRLLIANRKSQIIVSKLVGASDSFVRQPFLFLGFLYGLFGGLVAYGIYRVVFFLLQQPVNELASSYKTTFTLHQLNNIDSATLIVSASILGWLAARFSVGKHLSDIKPR